MKNKFKRSVSAKKAAEAEKEIRGEVFVPPHNLSTLMNFDFHSSVILLGNKGVGKSIFVSVLHEAYLENNELSLLITPNDMECDPILSKKTLSDRKSAAKGQILRSIAGIIGPSYPTWKWNSKSIIR